MAALVAELPWLEPLAECPQDSIFHAEGDVLTHLGMVLGELAQLPAFRELPEQDRHIVFAGTILHDIAKPECTFIEDGRVRSPGHSVKGVHKARRLLVDDPAFHSPSFAIREQILAQVRYHGLPANFLNHPRPERKVIQGGMTARLDLLAILAEADHRGRICLTPNDDTMTRIGLFPDFCRETGCWDGPYPFANDHSRFMYFRNENNSPMAELYDDTAGEVTLLAGLPGSGKSTWLTTTGKGLDAISLDEIREELDVDPRDDQSAVIAKAYDLARQHLRKKQPFVWNATNITRRMRNRLIDLCADYKARTRIIYVEPPIPVIRRQNREREKTVPVGVWERLFDKLEVPTLAEAHQVEYVLDDPTDGR
ncbi:AAA family ATPase [Zavarzinella formosa]|uniref:AAA family ATPase n=1 Tax=Zavarzinella formosa TaxID=360055 RepID=UPI001EE64E44|nr:AAA family ATPase [Zavarzinella formosa]